MVAALEPVVVPAGFNPPQLGDDELDVVTQIIFCAPHDVFSARHPRLPQANQQAAGGACVDLVIDVRADGTLARIDLEELTVAATLRHVGLVTEGDALALVEGRPLSESLPVVEAALRQVFSTDRGSRSSAM